MYINILYLTKARSLLTLYCAVLISCLWSHKAQPKYEEIRARTRSMIFFVLFQDIKDHTSSVVLLRHGIRIRDTSRVSPSFISINSKNFLLFRNPRYESQIAGASNKPPLTRWIKPSRWRRFREIHPGNYAQLITEEIRGAAVVRAKKWWISDRMRPKPRRTNFL